MTDTSVMTEFGKKFCDVPGYGDCWVQFKTSGYPRKLRREVDAADSAGLWTIIARYISASYLRDLSGDVVTLSADIGCLDDIEDAVTLWINRAFYAFWLVELVAPRPNS
jgi:hypothetical protein